MKRTEGKWVIDLTWWMVGVTFFLILNRTIVRTIRRSDFRSQRPSWFLKSSDIFAILAWLAFLMDAILTHLIFNEGVFDIPAGEFSSDITLYYSVAGLKLYYVASVTYLDCMFLVKLGVISVYFEWLPTPSRLERWVLRFIWAFTVVGFALNVLLSALWCIPISRNWSRDPQTWCSNNTSYAAGAILLPFHFISDLFIYLFPLWTLIPFLTKSKCLSIMQKLGLIASFSAGFLCIAVAAALLWVVENVGPQSQNPRPREIAYVLYAMEQTYALLAISLPALLGIVFRVVKLLMGAKPAASTRDEGICIEIIEDEDIQEREDEPKSEGASMVASEVA